MQPELSQHYTAPEHQPFYIQMDNYKDVVINSGEMLEVLEETSFPETIMVAIPTDSADLPFVCEEGVPIDPLRHVVREFALMPVDGDTPDEVATRQFARQRFTTTMVGAAFDGHRARGSRRYVKYNLANAERRPFVLIENARGHRSMVEGMSAKAAAEYLIDYCDYVLGDDVKMQRYLRREHGLTATEARIARFLVNNVGRVISRDTIFNVVYANRTDDETPAPKVLDVYVCKLRKKFAKFEDFPFEISTVWGTGYCLDWKPGHDPRLSKMATTTAH